ncbi:hypothetical protein O181_012144 [Austropuccinia psidii MF-1]|uniref:Uncharacterized protein n=1 Tax=Austropuccinia psidii MF-1 TaxID=1389203 RepID=A0A9Q3BVU5_9BASI|nr:hypothetical protein [Austropuccinia psidii MF-1]
MSIDNITQKSKKFSISVEGFEEKTSSHQTLISVHEDKIDEAIINLKYDIRSKLRLITEKMDTINKANFNIPKSSTPFSQIRSPLKTREEMKNPLIKDLSHQDNNQVLIKEAPQLKECPKFKGEGEYNHMSFIKIIDMLQEEYAIPDSLISAILHSLFEKSAKRWYYGIKNKWKKYLVLVKN